MIHHLYTLAIGLLFCFSVVVIPFLIGLPFELYLISVSKKQIIVARTWLIGSFALAILAIIYSFGAIFTQGK